MDRSNKFALIGCGGVLALAALLALIHKFGAGIAAVLFMMALYLRFNKDWDESKKPLVGGLVCVAVLIFSLHYWSHSNERQAAKAAEESEAESQKELAEIKASLSPGECEEAGRRTYGMMKDMCYRMYPSDSWGDSAGRMSCRAEEQKKMRACGVSYLPSR